MLALHNRAQDLRLFLFIGFFLCLNCFKTAIKQGLEFYHVFFQGRCKDGVQLLHFFQTVDIFFGCFTRSSRNLCQDKLRNININFRKCCSKLILYFFKSSKGSFEVHCLMLSLNLSSSLIFLRLNIGKQLPHLNIKLVEILHLWQVTKLAKYFTLVVL